MDIVRFLQYQMNLSGIYISDCIFDGIISDGKGLDWVRVKGMNISLFL